MVLLSVSGVIVTLGMWLMTLWMFVFFFQAEDGIRDAQESRGLGDVYKRQLPLYGTIDTEKFGIVKTDMLVDVPFGTWTEYAEAVSYTHLTLPTIYSV